MVCVSKVNNNSGEEGLQAKISCLSQFLVTSRLEKKMWGRELQESLPRAVFQDLLEDDAALLRFLQELETVGVVVVSGVPCQEGQVHRFTHRVGYWKRTHYGYVPEYC